MPTSGLVNTDSYIYLNHHVSQYHRLSRGERILSGPLLYQCFTHFHWVICQLGLCFSRTWGQGLNSVDPKHLERYETEWGAETEPASICTS